MDNNHIPPSNFTTFAVLSVVLTLVGFITSYRLIVIGNLILPAYLLPLTIYTFVLCLVIEIHGAQAFKQLIVVKAIATGLFLGALGLSSLLPTSPEWTYRTDFLSFMSWLNHAAFLLWLSPITSECITWGVIVRMQAHFPNRFKIWVIGFVTCLGQSLTLGLLAHMLYGPNSHDPRFARILINTLTVYFVICVFMVLPSHKLASRLK